MEFWMIRKLIKNIKVKYFQIKKRERVFNIQKKDEKSLKECFKMIKNKMVLVINMWIKVIINMFTFIINKWKVNMTIEHLKVK